MNISLSAEPILVAGGAGFIGSNFVRHWLARGGRQVINVDKLSYAGNLRNLDGLQNDGRHIFVRGDIGDAPAVHALFGRYRPRAIVNFAAESHVDRSIVGPEQFLETNVVGTFRFLEQVRAYWESLPPEEKHTFRLLHVSTDEVYGSLSQSAPAFSEATAYAPNSPYAASKACSDHWVRAYHHTYGLPTIITNCSNNYGPYQFPEKLIPLVIINAIRGKPLPVYGDGGNIRDWLYVEDHCEAICRALVAGRSGETYNVGGHNERTNLDVVKAICGTLDELHPQPGGGSHAQLISFVADRPGHDRRYAIDASKIRTQLGWTPRTRFEEGLRSTVQWYLEHHDWVEQVASGEYRAWVTLNYAGRSVL